MHNSSMIEEYSVRGIILDSVFHSGGFRLLVEDGRISSIEKSPPSGRWKECIALPGLIQSHLHLGQTLFRGMAEKRTLIPWLRERIWPLEASHTEDTLAVSVIQSLRELLSSGCTGLLDMGLVRNSAVTVDILRRSGIRALAGNALMDRGPEWIAEDAAWLREESDRISGSCGDRVGYVYTPRFALSCSDSIWEWLAGLPAGTRRTTHASESMEELRNPVIEASGGNIDFLGERGFLGEGALLAHCVHLLEGEVDLLARSGSTVVHCPWTNLRLGSGIADIPGFAAMKVNVILGSDGAACNNRLDLMNDLRLAMGLASVKGSPSAPDSGYWLGSVTSSAASALGWPGTGSIAVGNEADLVFLEPLQVEWEELRCAEDPLRYILELPWPFRTRMTMVHGDILFHDGSFPTLPELPLSLERARREVLDRAEALPPDFG